MEIKTIPIFELKDNHFIIPRFQRGYRWGRQEIEELLKDILDFADKNFKDNTFYCLQPLVVSKVNENTFRVIDGQQRLTTIYLLIQYLKRHDDSGVDINLNFSIEYMSRNQNSYSSKTFLENEGFKEENDSNTDFYHMSKAYEIIENWCLKNLKGYLLKFLTVIFETKIDKDPSIRFIWYEIGDFSFDSIITKNSISEKEEIDLFTRLNRGKIPLIDAELIKALLLQSDRCLENKNKLAGIQLQKIAQEWDDIIKNLSHDSFWFFLSKNEDINKFNRIQYFFEILADKWNLEHNFKIKNTDRFWIYLIFEKYFNYLNKDLDYSNYESVKIIWSSIKEVFQVIQEWYNNHIIFHYIGYLIRFSNVTIPQLIESYLKQDRDRFIKYLKDEISNTIKNLGFIEKSDKTKVNKELTDLSYQESSDYKLMVKIFTLFNIDAMIEDTVIKPRFPFTQFSKDFKVSLEHIHPQTPSEDDNLNYKQAAEWIEDSFNKIKDALSKNEFNNLESQINDHFEKHKDVLVNKPDSSIQSDTLELMQKIDKFINREAEYTDENQKHNIRNLALLDAGINSGISNFTLDIKREKLREYLKEGKFIPLCTQRVFTKYYTRQIDGMKFWKENDRLNYFNAIKETYDKYNNITL